MPDTHLSQLTLSTSQQKVPANLIEQRRAKLITRLNEQKRLATCLVEGKPFEAYKEKLETDEQGHKRKVRVPKRVIPWFYEVKGNYFLEVRYGTKPLELSKGNHAVTVGEQSKLVEVIDVVVNAVEAGELDAQLSAVSKPKRKG
ncbi:DUF6641 family protein [Nitrincola sp.]|uniref:DUF6641 family protein n=1 Tax=Nitrincola sp. TaxID=1926584 RepID=UPI003A942F06